MLTELDLEEPVLSEMLKTVHRYTGINMTEKKKNLLQSRLRPRLRELSLTSYEAYLVYLSAHKEEIETFIDRVTTNETFFFRTHRVWDFFLKQFLPDWMAKHPGETLKLWSAASSSGEEAYSLAICLAQYPDLKFEICASDISKEILGDAQKALYEERSVQGIQKYRPDWYVKYVTSVGPKWTIQDSIKKQVKFFQHNLLTPVNLQNMDIIFLRNVMIYFNDQDQKTVLKHMAKALKKDAYLILGESESISRFETEFKYVEPLVYKL
ncbi:CheR family methyltransferase [Peredibacter starrii]|uniref:protein-glutamate O-methyltransferase n=1 Tax=Peredibacter starrii TaxID=28202 RepID=A0AAX4HK92_9BACT|nr:protein-glutamate O-methyltransferase CheR [Peredibacter starrii]WPU63615.1 protein-glutamate O-methyltransferase CheR [Peredibacter starrii]